MAEWKKILLTGDAASLSDTTALGVSTAATAGTAADASRSDHVHDIDAGAIDASNLFAAGVVDATALGGSAVTTVKINADAVTEPKIADDAVGSEHIETLSAALDFGGNEADNMLADKTGTAAAAATAKLVYNTADSHLYVYT